MTEREEWRDEMQAATGQRPRPATPEEAHAARHQGDGEPTPGPFDHLPDDLPGDLDDSTALGELAVIFAIFAVLALAVLGIIGGAVLIVGLPS